MADNTAQSIFARASAKLLSAAVLISDLTTLSRMNAIETEIDDLQQEYALLNAKVNESRKRTSPYVK